MKRILVVDDQPFIRALLRAELTLDGYGVTDVGDIDSVRAYLSSSRPDLVILDLFLDTEEGFSLLPEIKRQYPRIPVIILTAYDSFRDDPRLSLADAYVIKSIDFAVLKKTVRKHLTRQLVDEPSREECWGARHLIGTQF